MSMPPPSSRQLLIPFAATSSPACREMLRTLALPRLSQLLTRLTRTHADEGDEYTLTPPHERALARAHGLAAADGQLPWAAWQAAFHSRPEPALDAARDAMAWITPCHWHVATDHITMSDPAALQLGAAESQALLAAMQPYFTQDGIALHYDQPTRWLAASEVFRGLATASLDRVLGRNVDAWMPEAAQAAPLRRLQNEMQMLLYTHPINDARIERGLLPVNSFWVSGAGALAGPLPPASARTGVAAPRTLAEPALREDWDAWARAWQQLDSTEIAAALTAVEQKSALTLTLCGERSAHTFEALPQGLGARISSIFGRKSLSDSLLLL